MICDSSLVAVWMNCSTSCEECLSGKTFCFVSLFLCLNGSFMHYCHFVHPHSTKQCNLHRIIIIKPLFNQMTPIEITISLFLREDEKADKVQVHKVPFSRAFAQVHFLIYTMLKLCLHIICSKGKKSPD